MSITEEDSFILDASEINLGRIIAQGILGLTYQGEVRQNIVAIKVLNSSLFEDEEHMKIFKNEIKELKIMRHPNLSLLMGYTIEPNVMIVTEYLKYDLDYFLKSEEYPTTIFDQVMIAKSIVHGMYWLHCNKLPHSHLKPSNILVVDNNKVKISDYGLGKFRSLIVKNYDLTNSSQLPFWTAPEILSQKIKKSSNHINYYKSDVYSFGIILWQLITRQQPYSQNDNLETFVDHVLKGGRPVIPENTEKYLAYLIKDCLSYDPLRRPPFSSILKRIDNFLIEFTIHDKIAANFWKEHFMNNLSGEVPFEIFIDSFFKFLGLVPIQYNVYDYLKNVDKFDEIEFSPLDIDYLFNFLIDSSKTYKKNIINMQAFGKMLDFFGPIPPSKKTFLKDLVDVLKQPWFCGDLATAQAENQLQNAEVGTFILRFSNSIVGNFVISKVSKPHTIEHFRIEKKYIEGKPSYSMFGNTYNTIIQLVMDQVQRSNLTIV